MTKTLKLLSDPTYRTLIFKFLFLHEKKNFGKSILYTKKYSNVALKILKWCYFSNKRTLYYCEKNLIKSVFQQELNCYPLMPSDILDLREINIFTGEKYKKRNPILLIYYWAAWKNHFFKNMERRYAFRFKMRRIKKRIRDGDSNYRKISKKRAIISK